MGASPLLLFIHAAFDVAHVLGQLPLPVIPASAALLHPAVADGQIEVVLQYAECSFPFPPFLFAVGHGIRAEGVLDLYLHSLS